MFNMYVHMSNFLKRLYKAICVALLGKYMKNIDIIIY